MIVADLNTQETYQNLSLIIDQFEKAALNTQKRAGIMAVMNAPLDGMDHVLLGSKKTLNKVQQTRGSAKRQRSAPEPHKAARTKSGRTHADSSDPSGIEVSQNPLAVKVTERDSAGLVPAPPSIELSGGISLDADLAEIFGENGKDAEAIQAYLKDCLGCDSRISFDWQVPAYDLLGPIADMIGEINLTLDKIEELTDPTKLLQGFCKAMNDFQIICIPDWTMILMSLKMLLNKYLQFGLSVQLDWTVILGPLLNVIVDGIASLVHQVAGVIFAPLDCAVSVLESLEALERAARDVGASAKAIEKGVDEFATDVAAGQFLPNAEFSTQNRDFTLTTDSPAGAAGIMYGSSVRDSDKPQHENAWASVVSGLEASTEKRMLVDADTDSIIGVLTAAVREAKDWIDEQVAKVLATIKSVKGLVGGGLSLQLQGLGLMTLIIQLVRVVMMIINLLRSGIKPANWCTYLEEHPEILEDALKKSLDPNASVSRKSVTVNGRTTTLESCVSNRTDLESGVLAQWINDLQKGR